MRRALAAAAVAALAVLLAAPGALAEGTVTVRDVDASSEFPKVTFSVLVTGPTIKPSDFAIRENGRVVTGAQIVPIAQTDTPVGIVLVVDVSGSMKGERLAQAKSAAKEFVAGKAAGDQMAVIAFDSAPRVVIGFTDDGAALSGAIEGLQARGETALFDGVRAGADLFGTRPDLQANLVVLSDGADTTSSGTLDQAKASVSGARAALFAVGLVSRGTEFDRSSLQQLAAAGGGQYAETVNAAELRALYGNVRRILTNQFQVTYTSAAQGSLEISVAVAGERVVVPPINVGSSVRPTPLAPPVKVSPSPFAGALKGSTGLGLVAVIVFGAAATVVVGAVVIGRRETPALSTALRPYGPDGGGADGDRPGDMELVQTAILKRVVEATARVANTRGVLDNLERKLEQADLPVRAAEALFFYLAAVVGTGLSALFLRGPFGAALTLLVVALVPIGLLNFLAERRRQKFAAQLPDMLRLLASSLRAGYSLLQGADAIVGQLGEPMRKELRRVLAEARLGRPLELALEDSARRVRSPDYDWAVMAIKIQREVGGNLAELLQTVADTMVARDRLRREISTLTAESRISAVVLAVLPVVIGFVVYALNPSYLDPLLHRGFGQFMLLSAIGVGILGFIWMRRIIDIEA